MLNRTDILVADDLVRELVDVPEWGGELYIATLMGKDRDDYEASILQTSASGEVKQNFTNMRAKLVARCAVNEKGKRIFHDKDIVPLGFKSARALDRCFSVAARLNAVSDADLEELAKNSSPTQSG
jgi:hypothetical protein